MVPKQQDGNFSLLTISEEPPSLDLPLQSVTYCKLAVSISVPALWSECGSYLLGRTERRVIATELPCQFVPERNVASEGLWRFSSTLGGACQPPVVNTRPQPIDYDVGQMSACSPQQKFESKPVGSPDPTSIETLSYTVSWSTFTQVVLNYLIQRQS